MKKLIDFEPEHETIKVVITSEQEFEDLKLQYPNIKFRPLENYCNYRAPRKKTTTSNYRKIDINQCKRAIAIERETEKAYYLQTSHISGHTNGVPENRHFRWVPKSQCIVVDGDVYYPFWI